MVRINNHVLHGPRVCEHPGGESLVCCHLGLDIILKDGTQQDRSLLL